MARWETGTRAETLMADRADREGTAGSSDPGARFRDIGASDEERAQIEVERARRLPPENRPENAEVDNTGQ